METEASWCQQPTAPIWSINVFGCGVQYWPKIFSSLPGKSKSKGSPSRREVSLSNILFYSSSSPYNMIIPKKTKTFVILEDIPDCNNNQNFTFNYEGLILHRGALRSWTRDPNKTVASRRLCFVKTSGLWPHWQIEKLKSLQLDWCGCPPQQWHGSSYSYLKLKYSTNP